MKTTIFLSLFIAFSASVFAQGPPPGAGHGDHQRATPTERAKKATDKLSSEVQLSKDQYDKVLEANTNYFNQQASLRGSGGPPNDADKSKFKALNEDRNNKLKAILTPDQWQKHEAARKQMQNDKGMHEGHGGDE